MIHVRVDTEIENSQRKFRCGLGPELPVGDKYYFEAEPGAWLKADCPGCNPGGPKQLGTPASQLSGRPGHPGYERFKDIAASWGYD
jgi:hypothetical protein